MAIFGTGASFTDETQFTSFTALTITIPIAGTPITLPSTTIPLGAVTSLRAKIANKKKVIYIANSISNVVLPAARVALRGGESVALNIDNLNKIIVDAEEDGLEVEVFVEQ